MESYMVTIGENKILVKCSSFEVASFCYQDANEIVKVV
jgi:hypothetical protein